MEEGFHSIGFIGVGAMGFHMAQRLIDKFTEATFYIYDVDLNATARFLEAVKAPHRVHRCGNAREVADSANTILTMVPEGSHVRDVFLQPTDGLLASKTSEKLFVDCSTIDPATTREVAGKVIQRSSRDAFYDAPVSGGVVGAEKGSLTFMLGCTDNDPLHPRLAALLAPMAGIIHCCGGVGAGVTTKLCNNYLSGLIAIAASEAMNIGIRSGLDPQRLSAVFHTSTAQNAILDRFHPVPGVDPAALSSHGYHGGFRVQLMRKDFGLAVRAAEQVGARLALGAAGLEVYEGASLDERCRDRDSRVVYRYLGGIENWKEQNQQEASKQNAT